MYINIVVVIWILIAADLVAFAGLFYLAMPGNETVGLCLMIGAVTVVLLTFLIPTRNTNKEGEN